MRGGFSWESWLSAYSALNFQTLMLSLIPVEASLPAHALRPESPIKPRSICIFCSIRILIS